MISNNLNILRKIVTRVSIILFIVLPYKTFSQDCSECNVNITSSGDGNLTIGPGDIVCVSSDVELTGDIFLNGGILCNYGLISSLRVNEGEVLGIINNYGSITCTDEEVTLVGNLIINSYPGSVINWGSDKNIQLETYALTLNNYMNSVVNITGETNITNGTLLINNGIFSAEALGTLSTLNWGSLSLNYATANFTNTLKGLISFGGSLNLDDSDGSSILNNGSFIIADGFNKSGDSEYEFTIDDNKPMSAPTGTFSIGSDMNIYSGIVNNSAFTFVSGSLINYSSGTINNNGQLITTGDSFDNQGVVNLSENSYLNCLNYYNQSGASINGPGAVTTPEEYATIIIDGNSENAGSVTGYVAVFDQSLTCPDAPPVSGYGFDVVSGSSVDGTVAFISNCVEGEGDEDVDLTLNCSQLRNALSLWIPSRVCPDDISDYDYVIDPTISYVGYASLPTISYVIEPGSITGTVGTPITLSPTVTTEYTLTAQFEGVDCQVSLTFTIDVMLTPPTIVYDIAPFFSTSTVNFGAVLTPPLFGVFSMSPAVSGVSINPSTGQITATGNCFGTYTVYFYTTDVPTPPCEYFIATTVIKLTDLTCGLSLLPGDSFTLCPGDKIQFTALVDLGEQFTNEGLGYFPGYECPDGGLAWAPAATSLTTGLSCDLCCMPTFTYSGGTVNYTVNARRDGIVCATKTINIVEKQHCESEEVEEIVGCCFSNYGAAVWLNDSTYLNVYCNLVNEISIPIDSVEHGEFQNEDAHVRVLLDWIHNGKNELYDPICTPSYYPNPPTCATETGTSVLFGSDQKMKGNSITHFYFLQLAGNGTKLMKIDEVAHGDVDLISNELSIGDHVFYMKNYYATIARTSGYASTGTNGYFSRVMTSTVQPYLLPLGAKATSLTPGRYRPLVILNNHYLENNEISANFMNAVPSLTDAAFSHSNTLLTNTVTRQAPNVLQLNNVYYHKIKNTGTPTVAPNITIKSYYPVSDGQFQSLAEWERDPAQTHDWWGATPGAAADYTPSSDPGTPGMINAMANGTFDFNHKPFILSKAGFFINTNDFGGPGGGTIFSVTATGGVGGAPTPTGGGLNNPFGTGSNSGNTGTGGPTIFTPSPVSGTYVISVIPANSCNIGGKIRYVIDQSNNISSSSVQYASANAPSSYFLLSEDVYTIDNFNTGITLRATPRDLLRKCVNSITVTTTSNDDYVLNQSSENLVLSLPAASGAGSISYGQFSLYSSFSLTPVYTYSPAAGSATLSVPALTSGVYHFELPVSATGTTTITETIKGQIIIKP